MTLEESNSPILRAVADQTDATTARKFIDAMMELMHEKRGVGLAAPQVGLCLAFFVSNIPVFRVAINPVVKSQWGNRIGKLEGCLSFPGRSTFVNRWEFIQAEWTDENGQRKTGTLQGMPARIFQHETDHVNGINIFP